MKTILRFFLLILCWYIAITPVYAKKNPYPGQGYVGKPPTLGDFPNKPTPESAIDKDKLIQNLTPDDVPTVYKNVITAQTKYSKYLKDVDLIIPQLDKLSEAIQKKNSVQKFASCVNVYTVQMNYMKAQYGDKKEHNYTSYKQLVDLNKNLKQVLFKWERFEVERHYIVLYDRKGYNNSRQLEVDLWNLDIKIEKIKRELKDML